MPIIVLEFVKTQVWYSEETDTALPRRSIKDHPLTDKQNYFYDHPPPPPGLGVGSMHELHEPSVTCTCMHLNSFVCG